MYAACMCIVCCLYVYCMLLYSTFFCSFIPHCSCTPQCSSMILYSTIHYIPQCSSIPQNLCSYHPFSRPYACPSSPTLSLPPTLPVTAPWHPFPCPCTRFPLPHSSCLAMTSDVYWYKFCFNHLLSLRANFVCCQNPLRR